MKPQPPPPPPPVAIPPPSLQEQMIPSALVRTPPTAVAGVTTPLIDDLELTAQRNLALARLNSSPLPPLNTNGGAAVGTTEQLYSHLYGSKEIGMMRKMATNMDDYSNAPRNYGGLHMHHAASDSMMQQNFSPQAKFNQFNYPNSAGLLKPCYDYPHTNQMMHSNQQMKKELYDLYQTPQSFIHQQQNAFNHHHHNPQLLQHPSFNHINGGLLGKLDTTTTGDNLNEFTNNNTNTNINTNANNGNTSNKSSDSVLLTRSSILNSNNSNKIEPNSNDQLTIANSGVLLNDQEDADKLSSPLTTESSLNNEHNDNDSNDDGYTIL